MHIIKWRFKHIKDHEAEVVKFDNEDLIDAVTFDENIRLLSGYDVRTFNWPIKIIDHQIIKAA